MKPPSVFSVRVDTSVLSTRCPSSGSRTSSGRSSPVTPATRSVTVRRTVSPLRMSLTACDHASPIAASRATIQAAPAKSGWAGCTAIACSGWISVNSKLWRSAGSEMPVTVIGGMTMVPLRSGTIASRVSWLYLLLPSVL